MIYLVSRQRFYVTLNLLDMVFFYVFLWQLLAINFHLKVLFFHWGFNHSKSLYNSIDLDFMNSRHNQFR